MTRSFKPQSSTSVTQQKTVWQDPTSKPDAPSRESIEFLACKAWKRINRGFESLEPFSVWLQEHQPQGPQDFDCHGLQSKNTMTILPCREPSESRAAGSCQGFPSRWSDGCQRSILAATCCGVTPAAKKSTEHPTGLPLRLHSKSFSSQVWHDVNFAAHVFSEATVERACTNRTCAGT